MNLRRFFPKKKESKKELERKREQNGFREFAESLNSSSNNIQLAKLPYFISDTGKARYLFEHQHLRDLFYSKTIQLTNALKNRNFEDLSCLIAQYSQCNIPFDQSDLLISSTRLSSYINIIMIKFPDPGYISLCYRIYMMYSDDYSNLGYYTIESSADDDVFLCGWDSINNHSKYQSVVIPTIDSRKGYHESNELEMLVLDVHAKHYDLTFKAEYNQENKLSEIQLVPLEKLLTKRLIECSNWFYKDEKLDFFVSPFPDNSYAVFHPSHPDENIEAEIPPMEIRKWTSLAIDNISSRLKILDAEFFDEDSIIGGLSIQLSPKYENGVPACWIDIVYDQNTTALTIERKNIVRIPESCVLSSRMAIEEYLTLKDILHVTDDGQVYAIFKTYYNASKALELLPEMVEMFQDVVDRIYPDLVCSSYLQSAILKTHQCSCNPDKQDVVESLIYGPLKDGPSSWDYRSICRCKNCCGYLMIDIQDGEDGETGPVYTRFWQINGLADAEAHCLFYTYIEWGCSGEEFGYLRYLPPQLGDE